jgi:hypothetical protein
LLLTNLVLLALTAACAEHLRREWVEARTSERAVLQRRIAPVQPPFTALPPAAAPIQAADYLDIARKMLFSRDRNSAVALEPPPPPRAVPMPPIPLFHGVLDLGDGPIAIMSEGTKGPQRDYQPGDKVGAFTLVALNNEELVLEWEGKTITKRVDEMLGRRTAARPASGPVGAAIP